jgi:TPP-dependent pyruvate/acetoin dehydrogenase alpha subunit
LAGGTAYAAQVKGEKAITVVFFGDGAMEEGVFYETLNIAKLWQLPMIFLMENNYRRAGRGAGHAAIELTNVPKALDVETTIIDGIDVGTVHKTAKQIVGRVRAGEGPLFVEARTHLWPGNAFNMPKLIGGMTDIAWAWTPAKPRRKCVMARRT